MKDELLEVRPELVGVGMSRPMLAVIVILSMLIGGWVGSRINAAPRPIASGELQSPITLWKKPLDSSSNSGGKVEPGSRVSIFEHQVVVTRPDGGQTVVPTSHVGPIQLKP